jgi:RNA polymerase sigma-70 factor (ECF subfamily)
MAVSGLRAETVSLSRFKDRRAMSASPDRVNRILDEYHAYLETLTFIQVDPRVRGKFGLSDVVQNTLVEAWRDLERIQALDEVGRKRWLRQMLVHNLLEEIERWRTGRRDVGLEQPLDGAAAESSCRLQNWLAVEDSSPSERLARQEEGLQLLEALSKLEPRSREALILQKYHGWTLAQIADHLGCTTNAVAGLHARGLKNLRKYLPQME